MELKQHPLSAAFPSMSEADFLALKDDIKANGQREPVLLYEGMVLDGWHRYRACCDLGLKPSQFTFNDGDPVAFVKSQNLHRRHLTASQRAAAVVACAAWVPSNIGRPRGAPGAPLETNAKLATDAHVALRTIQQAKAAHKAGLGDAVKEGVLTAKEADRIASGKPLDAPTVATARQAPAPGPVTSAPPQDDGPTTSELAAMAREQEEEADAVRRLMESDDKMATLAEENKKLRAEVRVLKERRDGLMNENNELVKRIKGLQRKVEKLEKGVPA